MTIRSVELLETQRHEDGTSSTAQLRPVVLHLQQLIRWFHLLKGPELSVTKQWFWRTTAMKEAHVRDHVDSCFSPHSFKYLMVVVCTDHHERTNLGSRKSLSWWTSAPWGPPGTLDTLKERSNREDV